MKKINKRILILSSLLFLITVSLFFVIILHYKVSACPGCYDSDSGQDYLHIRGYCEDDCSGKRYDECKSDRPGEVLEYYCSSDGECYSNFTECPNGECCSGGKCNGVTGTCSDTDGEDKYTKGTCTDACSGSNTDFCSLTEDSVIEFYCSKNGHCFSKKISCGEGYVCKDGKCVPGQPTVTCSDTDGKDKYTKGTCTDGKGESEDFCASPISVAEHYCKDNECYVDTIECPNGECCSGGKCNGRAGYCSDSDPDNKTSIKGTCTDACSGTLSDSCSSDGHGVWEYYCDGDNHCRGQYVSCPSGTCCKDGVCKAENCVECTPGETRSCTANCTYKKCVDSSCQSVTETFSGTQTCQSDGTWGPCALHSPCPSDQCSSDADCGCTPFDTRSCVTTCTFKDCVGKSCSPITVQVTGTQTCDLRRTWGPCNAPCIPNQCLENSECDCSSLCQSSGYASSTCRSTPAIFGTGADGRGIFGSGTHYITTDKNYTDMIVGPGATVIVNSGVKIKVQKNLIVYGTISADGKGGGGAWNNNGGNGQATDKVGGKGGSVAGGEGGNYGGGGGALDYFGHSFYGGSYGGGGAAVGISNTTRGGSGGGVLTIYAYSLGIKSGGLITASGLNGSAYNSLEGAGGGGGGRIYIFVGSGGFLNSGTLRAKGGNGACSDRAAGGGGGGGFIKVTAATTTNLGSVDVSGGSGASCGYSGGSGGAGSATVEVDQSLAGGCSAEETPMPPDGCPSGTVCCCSSLFDNPPKPPENLTEDINQCAWETTPQAALGLAITLRWDYSDPDGDPPGGYEIWLDDEDSFSDPKFNHKVDSSSNSYTLDLQQDDNSDLDQLLSWWSWRRFTLSLSWGKTYYWKVRVKDSKGVWSKWSTIKSFKTPSHASPNPDLSWDPQKPQIFQVVSFKDLSKCYDPGDIIVPCQKKDWVFDWKTGRSVLVTKGGWLWTFENGNPPSSTLQNPTTTFTSLTPSKVTLKVTDPDGYSCSATKTVQMNYPLPKWREIPPTSFFQEKIFASLTNPLEFAKIHLTKLFGKLKSKL